MTKERGEWERRQREGEGEGEREVVERKRGRGKERRLLLYLPFPSNSYIGRLNISEVFMSGVGDALSNHQDGEAKGIKAHFRMDESGLLQLDYVSRLVVVAV